MDNRSPPNRATFGYKVGQHVIGEFGLSLLIHNREG